MAKPDASNQTRPDIESRPQTRQPPMYKVLMHNDDYTTMEFVVYVLQVVFHHSPASASRIMLHIHKAGIGVAGLYTRDIAETRVEQVMQLAREAGHPLQCSMEPE